MKKSVWIGIPVDAGGEEKFGNYFRAVREAGGEAYCPDPGGDDFSCRRPETGTCPGGALSPDSGIRPLDCAALLLPGGGDLDPSLYGQPNIASRNLEPERDALEWNLLEQFINAGKPVLGICRGMQSMSVFLGGTLLQDIPGHTPVEGPDGRRDRLHPVRTNPGPFADLFRSAGVFRGADLFRDADLFLDGEDLLTVNSSHHQAVDRPGAGLTVEQWGLDGIAEAVRHRTLPLWGVQWHPERLGGETGRALFRAFLGLCQ